MLSFNPYGIPWSRHRGYEYSKEKGTISEYLTGTSLKITSNHGDIFLFNKQQKNIGSFPKL